MTTATQLFRDARMTQLGDPQATTWPDAVMVIAFNQAMRILIGKKPAASSKTETIYLKKGTYQEIPQGGVCLLRVVRNIKTDNSIGDAIRPVDMSTLDSVAPNWHQVTGNTIKEFCHDPRLPKEFYIYPGAPADNSVRVSIQYSFVPDDLTEDTLDEELPFDSVYDQALVELMLYKLLSGDNTQGQSSGIHLKTALDLVDVKSVGDAAASTPKG
jgi:hypothetical protein